MDYTFNGPYNLSKILFDTLYDLSAGRFGKYEDRYTDKGEYFYKMPFLPDDQLTFNLNISPHLDTFVAIPIKPVDTAISERVYKCILKMVP